MHKNKVSAIVVIGASAGGMEPMINIVRSIPAECQAAFFIVQHIPAYSESSLAQILDNKCSLPVRNAVNNEVIRPGHIYTAISDHHLLVEPNQIIVSKGPKENHWRPSVDALFRSAAYAYGASAIGVILSGALNDGTSGLWQIKQRGGISIIQDREEAVFKDMAESAAQYVAIDHELPSHKIGHLIGQLTEEMKKTKEDHRRSELVDDDFTRFEIGVAKGENALKNGVLDYGDYSPLACPECHGALTEYTEGKIKRFRCHTGHAHTSESLLAGIDTNIEKSIWEVMRGMEESQLLLNQLAEGMESDGDKETTLSYRRRATELAQRSQIVKKVIFDRNIIKAVPSD